MGDDSPLPDGGHGIEIVWSNSLNTYILEDHLDEHGVWQHEVLAFDEGQDKGSTAGFHVNWHGHFYGPYCKARALLQNQSARPKANAHPKATAVVPDCKSHCTRPPRYIAKFASNNLTR